MNKRQKKKHAKKVQPIPLETLQKRTPKQLSRFSNARLRRTYQKLRSTALKRLKRLEEYGYTDQSIYKEYQFAFDNPSRDMDDVDIKEKLLEIRKFLGNPESTVRGQKKREKQIKDSADLFNAIVSGQIPLDETGEPQFGVLQEQQLEYYYDPDAEGYEKFIDTSDPDQLRKFEQFLSIVNYNAKGYIQDPSDEYFELWVAWLQSGEYVGKFSHAPDILKNAAKKFFDSAIITGVKKESTIKAQRRWLKETTENREK